MKKITLSAIVIISSIISVQAQLYTPNGTIQGSSSNNNVGVGTTSPTTKLDVLGTIKSYESTPLSTITNSFQLINEIGGSTGSNNKMINKKWLLRDATSDNWWTARLHDGISVDVSFMTPHLDTKTWWERDPHDNIQSWGNAGETYLTINKGNVGIGTTNPLHKFVVSNEGAEEFDIYIDKPFNVIGLQSYNRFLNSYSKMQLNASQFSFMIGNVGIGTQNPDSKLTVAGNIHAQEVKVTVNAGADFVFENDYNLPSLTSVETFIKENKHLPEIASAKKMKENGINLSEMNIKLLQKIEELTLYTIEQEKNIKSQNNKIIKLEKQNEKLLAIEKRLEKIEMNSK